MRDIILNRESIRSPMAYYHILGWSLFILYEISFSAALRGSYNHFIDYLLHYPLYIILFYVHCYIVLKAVTFKKASDYIKINLYIFAELACYYGINVLINTYLVSSGLPVNVIDTSSKLFYFATIYRFIYITALSTALRIAINLMSSQKRNMEIVTQSLIMEREKEVLQTELINAELAFLRSQINPHFLFNSLNSVYNRVRKNDPKSAEYVMALADLMQYAIKPQSQTEEVPVDSELEHISNYLKLQQMRYSTHLDLKISNDDAESRIIPLLLISLIENVFQHGNLNGRDEPPIIHISVMNRKMCFLTSNCIRTDPRPGNGVGLINTRKRLELHYPGMYILKYGADKDIFKLKLDLNLN